MIRVQVADDHQIVRQGLIRILAAEPDVVVVGEAGDCAATLAMVGAAPPDILLLDLSMPGRGGLDVLKVVRETWPAIRVIVLTMHAEAEFGVRAMRLGAAGYVTKDAAASELIKAIRHVWRRGKYVSSAMAEALAFDIDGSTGPRSSELSDRERTVYRGIAAGRSLTDIAGAMSLSVKTVSTYRARLLGKLGLRTNADLVRHAVEAAAQSDRGRQALAVAQP